MVAAAPLFSLRKTEETPEKTEEKVEEKTTEDEKVKKQQEVIAKQTISGEMDSELEYKGTSYIELIDEEKNYREVIKRDLIFPGSTKIVYFLIRELSNEKIIGYINGKRD